MLTLIAYFSKITGSQRSDFFVVYLKPFPRPSV